MNRNSQEVTSHTNRASSASHAEVKTGDGITNGKKKGENNSLEKEPELNGNIKEEMKSKDTSEQSSGTKDENNQTNVVLKEQSNIKENLDHHENNISIESRNSCEIQVENDNDIIIDEVKEQKSAGCCGCLVDVCYCMTWYCQLMKDSIVYCFRNCGSYLRNLCQRCGNNRNRNGDDSDGNYCYSDLTDTFNNDIDRDGGGIAVTVEDNITATGNDSSVSGGNEGGYDNCGVDRSDTCVVVGESRGAGGNTCDGSGVTSNAGGYNRGASGLTSVPVGDIRGATGSTCDASGVTSVASGDTHDAGGNTHDAGGNTHDAGGDTCDASGVTSDAGGADTCDN